MKQTFSILLLLVILTACKKEEDNEPTTKEIELENINDYWIYSIAFDSKGTAWLGTYKQGLIKYNPDGSGLVYNWNNTILPDSCVIEDIAIDSKDNVWIGTDALIKYDGETFVFLNSENNEIPNDNVRSIAIDHDDNIWFNTSRTGQGGIAKYDGTDLYIYTPDNSDLPVNGVHSITLDNKNNIWVAGNNKYVGQSCLIKISGSNWQIYTKEDLGYSVYYWGEIIINSRNELFGDVDYSLSSAPHFNIEIIKYDGEIIEVHTLDVNAMLFSLAIDDQDNLWWVGNYHNGIYGKYDGHDWYINEVTFSNTQVWTIKQAPDSRMWFGTTHGIYIMD